jgi:hypothetical protein
MEFDTRADQLVIPGAEGAPTEAMISFRKKYLNHKVLRPAMIAAYAELFAADELRDLASFYSSPLGKKVQASQGQLMAAAHVPIAEAYRMHRAEFLEAMGLPPVAPWVLGAAHFGRSPYASPHLLKH